jgi:hypothetical protein
MFTTMKKLISISIFLFAQLFAVYSQEDFNIQSFSDTEIEQLSTTNGCGCYINDVNHCGDDFYLIGDAEFSDSEQFSIQEMYVKINGKVTKFSFSSQQYSLRFTGEPEPVFDLYFDSLPNEIDINNAIRHMLNVPVNINIVKSENNKWIVDESWIYQHNVEMYYLFTSEKFNLRLYEYKHGVGMESEFTKGEVFIYKKDKEWHEQSLFFILVCGC